MNSSFYFACRRTAVGLAMLLASVGVHAQGADELQTWCQALAARMRGVATAQCAASALERGEGRSVKGVPLWRRDIAPSDTPAQLRVMVLGGIHGDEAASVALVFDWMERAVAARRQRVHWRMVPLVNPDGLLRRPATRVNARGVDLNRNFATDDWVTDAQTYWIRRTGRDPRRFPGRSALSEPETQWVHAQIEQFRPDLIVSVHAPYGVLDFDGPPPAPSKLGSLILDQVGIYPGSLGNYGGLKKGVPVVTIELRNALSLPGRETALMWADLQEWIDKRLLRVASAEGKPRAGSGSR